jgi:hypothetical protein
MKNKKKDASDYFILFLVLFYLGTFVLIGVCIYKYSNNTNKCESYGGTYKIVENQGKYKIYGCVKE